MQSKKGTNIYFSVDENHIHSLNYSKIFILHLLHARNSSKAQGYGSEQDRYCHTCMKLTF